MVLLAEDDAYVAERLLDGPPARGAVEERVGVQDLHQPLQHRQQPLVRPIHCRCRRAAKDPAWGTDGPRDEWRLLALRLVALWPNELQQPTLPSRQLEKCIAVRAVQPAELCKVREGLALRVVCGRGQELNNCA